MTTCKGCGISIPLARGGPERLWCSERCRKRQYDRVCSRCGGRASGTDPSRTLTDLCKVCFAAEAHETSVAWLIAELRHWRELYGRPPSAYEWELATVYWKQQAYAEGRHDGRFADATVAQIERRHREDGPWPSTSTVLSTFGSWNAAIEAAGFDSLAPGSKRGAVKEPLERQAA
jgi:hypothetical protein